MDQFWHGHALRRGLRLLRVCECVCASRGMRAPGSKQGSSRHPPRGKRRRRPREHALTFASFMPAISARRWPTRSCAASTAASAESSPPPSSSMAAGARRRAVDSLSDLRHAGGNWLWRPGRACWPGGRTRAVWLSRGRGVGSEVASSARRRGPSPCVSSRSKRRVSTCRALFCGARGLDRPSTSARAGGRVSPLALSTPLVAVARSRCLRPSPHAQT